jgi:membrane protease subunit (stomatin/prohibitin family)
MGILGDMNRYTQFQVANAVEAGAMSGGGNPGMELGMGVALGGQLAQTLQQGAAAPPPLPQSAAWFAGINGAQVGPMDAGALSAKIAAGEVTRETLVWKQGMAGWVAASTVPEVAALFGAVPPPLPQ